MAKLTILYAPEDAVGHVNSCLGVAEHLRDRGHKVVFAVPNGWKGKMAALGFLEEWYSTHEEPETGKLQPVSAGWSEFVTNYEQVLGLSPIEQIEKFQLPVNQEVLRNNKNAGPRLKAIVARVKPDVIVVDNTVHQPFLMNTGIPWVLNISMAPLGLATENVPPAFSGYPMVSDRCEWEKYQKIRKLVFQKIFSDCNSWVMANGGPDLKNWKTFLLDYSPHANVYIYPQEMDYDIYRPYPPNFYRFDSLVRSSSSELFEIPDKIRNLPGKLIYFSMGSIGSCLLRVMRRLISILRKSPHRFIVSKGPMGDELVLPENMWGANSLPQTKVLPLVDLVISHGGNNSLTETFYFGKPIIILPLWTDQHDNGQRVHETGHGLCFHPYHVPEEELLGAVEKLLADDLLAKRMKTISTRIQNSNPQARAADLIEMVAVNGKTNKTPF